MKGTITLSDDLIRGILEAHFSQGAIFGGEGPVLIGEIWSEQNSSDDRFSITFDVETVGVGPKNKGAQNGKT